MSAMLGELPTWNLSDLYASPASPDLEADLKRAAEQADAFAKAYEGKVGSLDGNALAERGMFSQNVSEKLTDIGSKLVFFTLEINRIDDVDLAARLKEPALAKYGPWLRDVRAFRPHQLSDEIEKLLHEKYVAGKAAWSRLFDETIARLRYPFRNEILSEAQILDKLSNKDGAVRKDAAKSFGKIQGENISVFGLITNTLAKDKEIEDRWRHYPRAQSARNLSNQVEDEVVDALAAAVKAAYPRLAHRYYKLKAKWFGVEQMPYWDRNAPLPEHDDRIVPSCRGKRRARPCSMPMPPSRPIWPRSAPNSSMTAGSTRRRARASRPAPSPIRPCRRRILTCC